MVARAHPAPTRGTMLPGPVTEAIEVLDLRKTYGATVAVDDVSFSVRSVEHDGEHVIVTGSGNWRMP